MTRQRIIKLAGIALAAILLIVILRAAFAPHVDPLSTYIACINNQVDNPSLNCGPMPVGP